ncbi:MAG: hypothetical protein R3D71_10015 [Rickettsiales bacterium]
MKKFLIIISIVILCLYGTYHAVLPSSTVRYKLTLNIDDNGKLVTGYSVVEVYRQDTTRVFGSSLGGYGAHIKGEAVAVDLGDKGVLFALLKGDSVRNPDSYSNSEPPYIIVHAFKSYFENNGSIIDNMNKLKQDKPKTRLSNKLIPMLVRFRDINDSTTVERVNPNNLEKAFGKGVRLVSAKLEITNESVTRKIENVLPVWNGKKFSEWRKKIPYGNSLAIDRIDFERK